MLPRYDPPGGRASQSVPARYLVRLQRPYSGRPGVPLEIDSTDDFEDALATPDATLLWVPTGHRRGTLVAVDPDASVAVPDLLAECATLLALRTDD